MMILPENFPERFTRIDELTEQDHPSVFHEGLARECYYLGEYRPRHMVTDGNPWEYSTTNQLIWNFKKPIEKKGTPEWKHKAQAIERASRSFARALANNNLSSCCFVPIPPSKASSDPSYDDRLVQMLRHAQQEVRPTFCVEELLFQHESREAQSSGQSRLTPNDLQHFLRFNEKITGYPSDHFVIVDDIITNGTSYVASRWVLAQHFPAARFSGLFMARTERLSTCTS